MSRPPSPDSINSPSHDPGAVHLTTTDVCQLHNDLGGSSGDNDDDADYCESPDIHARDDGDNTLEARASLSSTQSTRSAGHK